MHIVVAPDSFKGTASAPEAAAAIAMGVRQVLPEATVTTLPMADGGEGTAQVLAQAAAAGGQETQTITLPTTDAVGRLTEAQYFLAGHTAFIDVAAATAALEAAKSALGGSVVGGAPAPIEVGAGGISVSGNSPDNAKSVTVVLFTEGRAFVTLEFDGPKDATPPPDFVLDVGQKQALAIKNGLHG